MLRDHQNLRRLKETLEGFGFVLVGIWLGADVFHILYLVRLCLAILIEDLTISKAANPA